MGSAGLFFVHFESSYTGCLLPLPAAYTYIQTAIFQKSFEIRPKTDIFTKKVMLKDPSLLELTPHHPGLLVCCTRGRYKQSFQLSTLRDLFHPNGIFLFNLTLLYSYNTILPAFGVAPWLAYCFYTVTFVVFKIVPFRLCPGIFGLSL